MTQIQTAQQGGIKSLVAQKAVQDRFKEILGEKSAAFTSSIITAVNNSAMLQKCDPNTILGAAVVAATMDLPINQSLGFAHIVPYGTQAQFQLGWRGYVQLAQRTGQYKTINATAIKAGQLKRFDPLAGEYEFDFSSDSGEVVGYAAYFKMHNGFEKTVYMNVGQIAAHGKKYSKSYSNASSQWQTNFEGMSLKTVIKNLLSKWGMLSIEMQSAVEVDQAVVTPEGKVEVYPDAPETEHTPFEDMPTKNGAEKIEINTADL